MGGSTKEAAGGKAPAGGDGGDAQPDSVLGDAGGPCPSRGGALTLHHRVSLKATAWVQNTAWYSSGKDLAGAGVQKPSYRERAPQPSSRPAIALHQHTTSPTGEGRRWSGVPRRCCGQGLGCLKCLWKVLLLCIWGSDHLISSLL